MALKVWLPLNGNLNNQGLSDIQIVNNGATVDNSGKIGSCYSFDGTDDYISLSNLDFMPDMLPKEWTICFWVYNNDSGDRSIYFSNYQIGGVGDASFGFEKTAGELLRIVYNSGKFDNTISACSIDVGKWTHLTISKNINHLVSVYKNGNLVASYTNSNCASNGTLYYLGRDNRTGATTLNGKLNDFRIYDECLSQKQIKEISKGLIVHYKLSTLGLPNLAKNTNTTSIDTNICRLHLQTGGCTHTIEYDEYGIPCVKIVRDDVEHSGWSYLSYDNIDRNTLTTSTTYTISMDVKATVNGTISLTGILNGNATNYMTNSVENINGTVIANQWNHLVFRCTTISDFSTITLGSQVLYWAVSAALRATGITIWVKNVKLEKGSQNTPWIPYISDERYEKLGYNNTRIRDCSGYGYNGTETVNISNTIEIARYITSSYFVTTNAYYTLPVLTTAGFANSYSFAWWSKHSNMEGHMAWGFSDGNRLNLYPTSSTFCLNTGDGSSNPFKDDSSVNVPFTSYNGAWHHYVITGDGTKSLLYIDGEKKGTAQTYKGITGTQIYLSGWDTSTNYSWGSAYLSDFRIYATALDADSIRQLYETSALIDNETNAYSFEFVEEV